MTEVKKRTVSEAEALQTLEAVMLFAAEDDVREAAQIIQDYVVRSAAFPTEITYKRH